MSLELPDNHNKECKMVNHRIHNYYNRPIRIHDVLTIADCSLCGGAIMTSPYRNKRRPECGARVTL